MLHPQVDPGRNFQLILLVVLLSARFIEASSLNGSKDQLFQNRTFTIDYEHDTFLLDGAPFRYVSGSIHYFRIPRGLWKDRLSKVRAAGFNAIQFVIPWNMHQRHPPTEAGEADFTGDLDIGAFLEEAAQLGLYALVRPGPYICAEHNGGGLPWWLYKLHPDIKLRSNDPNFIKHVSDWWNVLLPNVLKKHLYSNGGNILMVQLENEYGSYPACDLEYTSFLRDTALKLLGPQTVLYTTDGAGTGYLKCGKVPDVYATVDFGPGGDPGASFHPQRLFQPKGPLANSEFYPGWLDYWGGAHSKRDANSVAEGLDKLLQYQNASVSLYMMHGGTSFGFENGINACGSGICVEPTSYDYDAPISEAGDLTPKYYAIKDVIAKHFPSPPSDISVSDSKKMNIGKVSVDFYSDIFQGLQYLSKKSVVSDNPLKFEDLDQENGFVLYRHVVQHSYRDPCVLQIASGIRDRAQIFINQVQAGILSRQENMGTAALLPALKPGDTLDLLVENQGRIGYQMPNVDFKGILGDVTVSGKALKNWTMYSIPMEDASHLRRAVKAALYLRSTPSPTPVAQGKASVWFGKFTPNCTEAGDTFLKLTGWSKGVAYVNGFNLGRYWPIMGPQLTLYVPMTLIKCNAVNTLHLFEQEEPACKNSDGTVSVTCQVELVDHHEVDGPVPEGTADAIRVHSTMTTQNFRTDL